ncbi:MAG: hypothetical protein H6598_03190 [Flavobacteriales bacterium]|nr:hypothetical protein [Flavobacteriales bacterium]
MKRTLFLAITLAILQIQSFGQNCYLKSEDWEKVELKEWDASKDPVADEGFQVAGDLFFKTENHAIHGFEDLDDVLATEIKKHAADNGVCRIYIAVYPEELYGTKRIYTFYMIPNEEDNN